VMLVQKYSKKRQSMVNLAVMIDVLGPGTDTWAKEGGGGWWGTARETEKLLAVALRLHMKGAGNGLGVMFGLVTGGTRVRFFKWTNDKSEKIGGRIEDLAVLLGLADDEEDYDPSDDEMPTQETGTKDSVASASEFSNISYNEDIPMELKYDLFEDAPSQSKFSTPSKIKGKTPLDPFDPDFELLSPSQDDSPSDDPPPYIPYVDNTYISHGIAIHANQDHLNPVLANNANATPTKSTVPPHHTSQNYVPDPEDIFDIRLPPETDRGGYYDMLWQGDKCSRLFRYIGSYNVD